MPVMHCSSFSTLKSGLDAKHAALLSSLLTGDFLKILDQDPAAKKLKKLLKDEYGRQKLIYMYLVIPESAPHIFLTVDLLVSKGMGRGYRSLMSQAYLSPGWRKYTCLTRLG